MKTMFVALGRTIATWFPQPIAQRACNTAWLEEQERRQMVETRDRLKHVEHQLWEIERRHQERRGAK